MIDQLRITHLANQYATKRQAFEAHRYQNTAGKTAEQQRQQTVAYYLAEAEMIDAYDQLQLAMRPAA